MTRLFVMLLNTFNYKCNDIYVAIPGIHVRMGYFRYCGSFVLQPQCVACSVAGVIS